MGVRTGQSQEPFDDEERDAILRVLGYPNWAGLAQSIQLGYPAASQPAFLVFDSLDRIRPASRARVREDLCRWFEVEEQLAESRTRRKTRKVGEVEMNGAEAADLVALLRHWAIRIADALGVVPNPYSQAEWLGESGATMNARVVG